MIQLNLLPDIKLDYIKAQRSRGLVVTLSIVVTGVSVGLLVLMLSASALQKKHLGDVNADIKSLSSQLQKQPQIDKILTVQNQLNSLTDLHAAKPAVIRMPEYLNQLTPAQISITNATVKFEDQSISITGKAESLASVNQYIDTLKFTTFNTDEDKDQRPAFSGVVLSSFKLTSDSNPPATYTISLSYDPDLFDITKKAKLTIPKRVTTRSQVERPTDLFQAAPATNEGEN